MRKISRVLVTCALLGIAVVGLTGCGMNSSAELAANENYWDGEYSLFTNNKDYTVTEASSLRDVMARI